MAKVSKWADEYIVGSVFFKKRMFGLVDKVHHQVVAA